MKVPYLNRKRQAEEVSFARELTRALASAMRRQHRERISADCFRSLYPLFCVLRSFKDPRYQPDPSKEHALLWLQQKQDRERFLALLLQDSQDPGLREAAREGIRAVAFSEFFDELFSDCLLILVHTFTFNYRGAMIALRCALEDLYRHLYYKDHPQELHALRNGVDDAGASPSQLRQYLQRTSYLQVFHSVDSHFEPPKTRANASATTEPFNTLFATNERLYAEASVAVHGGASPWLSGFATPGAMVYDSTRQQKLNRTVRDFSEMAISFLIGAHLDRFSAFDDYTKSLVLAAFTEAKRRSFRTLLNV